MEPLAASQAKTGTYPSCSDQAPKLFVLIVGPEAQAGGLSPSLEDCSGVPNSQWLWGSVALPACSRAFAQSGPGGVGAGRRWGFYPHRQIRMKAVTSGISVPITAF